MKKITAGVISLGILASSTLAGETINGAGATFPYPLYAAWAYQYYKETGIKLNYQSIGSGGGVRQIANRTVDFGASDDPLTPEKLDKLKLYQWPQVIGGEVLAVNIPGVKSGQMVLDADTVCHIYLGDIKYWDDPKLKALNPKLKLPHKKIKVIHRSDGSGTTAVFTHYLDEACKDWHKKVGFGKAVKWPVGIGGKGNEGVANYVKRLRYSIGYVEYAYALQNRLKYTLLKNPSGRVVKPSLSSFSAAGKYGNYNPKKHFYTWITNTPGPDAWPIVAATNILVAREKPETAKKVIKFFNWAFGKKGDEIAKRLVYAPLPEELKNKIRRYWKNHGIAP